MDLWLLWAAEGEVNAWWIAAAAAAATIISAVVTAAVTLMTTWSQQKKAKRTDALEEWQEIAEKQQRDFDRVIVELRDTQSQVRAAEVREAQCQVKVARLEGDVRLLESTVRRLQRLAGDEAPVTVMPGLVIADAKGIIQVASPALTPILHYLPNELRGKSVEVLMPDRYKEAHRTGLAAITQTGQPPWSDKAVIGEALTKEGEEIPVIITMSGWRTVSGDWLISAEIRPQSNAYGSSVTVGKGSAPTC
jgi:PAS domain S-box-containing protein